jgi:nitric oxide reductase activation protein
MGRDLHRPLDDRPGTRQRYKTADGRIETVPVATPKSGNAPLKEKLEQRRPKHKQIARDLAKQLTAIREQTEQRIRFQKDGRIDRRRFVAAVKGAEDVKTKVTELPATSFAASVAVDLSGSMSTLIQNGSLFDATMILSDTFENLDIAHEIRGFGSDAAHFKSMGDPRFDPDRAAMLAAGDRGGTNMVGTAGLATHALRAREEGNKLFVSLSDGALGDHRESVAILKEARRNGVATFGIFLGAGAPQQQMDELYGPGNWVQINDLKEFPVTVGRRISQIFKQMR